MLNEYLSYLQEARLEGRHALLVIDITKGCCEARFERWGNKFSNVRKMVPKLPPFIKWYKKNTDGLVIYVNVVKWIKDHLAGNVSRLYDENPGVENFNDEGFTKDALDFYKVKPERDDIIITKNTYDAFTAPEMKKALKKHNIKDLVITGVFGTGCVNATINGAFSSGYSMVIIKDLIESMDASRSLQTKLEERMWKYMYGPVMTSKDFIKNYDKLTVNQMARMKK